jgi:hypothetical protein
MVIDINTMLIYKTPNQTYYRLNENMDRFQSALNDIPHLSSLEAKMLSLIEGKNELSQASKDIVASYKQEMSSYTIRIDEAKSRLQKQESTLAGKQSMLIRSVGIYKSRRVDIF